MQAITTSDIIYPILQVWRVAWCIYKLVLIRLATNNLEHQLTRHENTSFGNQLKGGCYAPPDANLHSQTFVINIGPYTRNTGDEKQHTLPRESSGNMRPLLRGQPGVCPWEARLPANPHDPPPLTCPTTYTHSFPASHAHNSHMIHIFHHPHISSMQFLMGTIHSDHNIQFTCIGEPSTNYRPVLFVVPCQRRSRLLKAWILQHLFPLPVTYSSIIHKKPSHPMIICDCRWKTPFTLTVEL